ncbi:hypothetical protein [Rhodonellum sp.]|uniref:hypothetical protein n=1 Tax=Rhodonellum sp. TaxID=2231180 RepID=UPI002718A23D|nr:hypothetical protein [Rhodonellum sp.]MDO9553858.1 hypothetical protein [Rhodonellum sp.]
MKKFIAYFDYLGFRKFIENNELYEQKRGMEHRWRDIEQALTNDEIVIAKSGAAIADLNKAKINCINFSDTIVYWTNDDSLESLIEILKVGHLFNWKTNIFFFPVRGSIVWGEIESPNFSHKNEKNFIYNINSIYGKGLINAYEKAESQDWAGTVIDQSILDQIVNLGENPDIFLDSYAIKYNIPYKRGIFFENEFALRLVDGTLNMESFKNKKESIFENFNNYKKGPLDPFTQIKFENTIKFLEKALDPTL